jgi:hypothetical protein
MWLFVCFASLLLVCPALNAQTDELPLVIGDAMRSAFDLVAIVPESKGKGGSITLGGGQAAAVGCNA